MSAISSSLHDNIPPFLLFNLLLTRHPHNRHSECYLQELTGHLFIRFIFVCTTSATYLCPPLVFLPLALELNLVER